TTDLQKSLVRYSPAAEDPAGAGDANKALPRSEAVELCQQTLIKQVGFDQKLAAGERTIFLDVAGVNLHFTDDGATLADAKFEAERRILETALTASVEAAWKDTKIDPKTTEGISLPSGLSDVSPRLGGLRRIMSPVYELQRLSAENPKLDLTFFKR